MTVIYHLGTPGSPGTPDTILNVDATGWASGAISIPSITGNGGYQFKVPQSVVGAVCGIADGYRGVGYTSITHALYFSRGAVSLLENGATIQTLGSYVSSDVWITYRSGASFFVYKNGAMVVNRPALFGGAFILAGALYAVGDTINDAKVITVAIGSGDTRLGGVSALGMQGASNFGAVTLSLDATGTTGSHGWASFALDGVMVKASNYAYTEGEGVVGQLDVFGEQTALAPSWALAETSFGGFSTSSFGFTGAVGTGAAALGGVQALASNKPYGDARGQLPGLDAFGAEALDLNVGLLEFLGGYSLIGRGVEGESSGGRLKLPALTLAGQLGMHVGLRTKPVSLSASMTIANVLRGEMALPAVGLSGAGTITIPGGGEMDLPGRYSLDGRSGWLAVLPLTSGLTLEGEGFTGESIKIDLSLPGHYTLDGEGTVGELTVWSLTLPAVTAAPSGQAWLVMPTLKLYGSGGAVVATEYESYAINIATGAVTRYTNYPFDNVLRFGDRFFGVRSDGVFELTGDTDNGDPIEAVMTTFMTNFGVENMKRVKWIYLFGRMGEGMNVTFKPDEGVGYTYQTTGVTDGTIRMHRARPGGKIQGNYYEFTLANVNGAKFHLDRVEAIVDTTTRAL